MLSNQRDTFYNVQIELSKLRESFISSPAIDKIVSFINQGQPGTVLRIGLRKDIPAWTAEYICQRCVGWLALHDGELVSQIDSMAPFVQPDIEVYGIDLRSCSCGLPSKLPDVPLIVLQDANDSCDAVVEMFEGNLGDALRAAIAKAGLLEYFAGDVCETIASKSSGCAVFAYALLQLAVVSAVSKNAEIVGADLVNSEVVDWRSPFGGGAMVSLGRFWLLLLTLAQCDVVVQYRIWAGCLAELSVVVSSLRKLAKRLGRGGRLDQKDRNLMTRLVTALGVAVDDQLRLNLDDNQVDVAALLLQTKSMNFALATSAGNRVRQLKQQRVWIELRGIVDSSRVYGSSLLVRDAFNELISKLPLGKDVDALRLGLLACFDGEGRLLWGKSLEVARLAAQFSALLEQTQLGADALKVGYDCLIGAIRQVYPIAKRRFGVPVAVVKHDQLDIPVVAYLASTTSQVSDFDSDGSVAAMRQLFENSGRPGIVKTLGDNLVFERFKEFLDALKRADGSVPQAKEPEFTSNDYESLLRFRADAVVAAKSFLKQFGNVRIVSGGWDHCFSSGLLAFSRTLNEWVSVDPAVEYGELMKADFVTFYLQSHCGSGLAVMRLHVGETSAFLSSAPGGGAGYATAPLVDEKGDIFRRRHESDAALERLARTLPHTQLKDVTRNLGAVLAELNAGSVAGNAEICEFLSFPPGNCAVLVGSLLSLTDEFHGAAFQRAYMDLSGGVLPWDRIIAAVKADERPDPAVRGEVADEMAGFRSLVWGVLTRLLPAPGAALEAMSNCNHVLGNPSYPFGGSHDDGPDTIKAAKSLGVSMGPTEERILCGFAALLGDSEVSKALLSSRRALAVDG